MSAAKPARAKTTPASNNGSFATKTQTVAEVRLPAHPIQAGDAEVKQDIDTLASELPGVFIDRADDAWYIAEAVIGSRWLADHDGAHGAALATLMSKAEYADRRAIIAEVIAKFSYELGGSNLHMMEKIRGHFAIPAEATAQRESTAAKAAAWEEACQAFAWCLDNGSSEDALTHVVANNPYREVVK